MKNKGTNKQQQPDSGNTIHLSTVHVCTKFYLLGLTVPEKNVTKTFNIRILERNMKK